MNHMAPSLPIEAYEENNRRSPARPMIKDIEWFDDITPVLNSSYLVKGLLDHGSMSVIYGPSNSGKTFFALDVAYHIAASSSWRDRRVVNGTVLYLAAEGGNGIANRIVALKQERQPSQVPFALRRAGLDLLRPEADVQRIVDLAQDLDRSGQIALIVIDTLSRVLAGGDENGPADMTAFVKNVDRIRQETGAHVLIVHHTGKDAARGARGHSSLRAATDTEIEITVNEGGTRTATVQKQRDYQGGETFSFDLHAVEIGHDQDGDPVRTCIVVEAEQVDAKGRKKVTQADQDALRSLDDAIQAHGVKRQGADWQSCQVVSTENWRTHFYKHFDDDEPETKKKAFQRARKRLKDGGHIQFFDDHYWTCFG